MSAETVKHVWNDAIHVLLNFWEFDINTRAFLARFSLHHKLLKSSMTRANIRLHLLLLMSCMVVTNDAINHFLPTLPKF